MGHYKPIKIWNISTSEKELIDLVKAWLCVSFAFAIAFSYDSLDFLSIGFYTQFVIAFLTVGTGFLLHELGHKIVAQKYRCFAEFRSFDNMLVLAVIMSFAGIVFAAPGAVMISGRINERKNGIISAAGPLVNIALALVFLGMILAGVSGVLFSIASYGFRVNSWLALFNMIPAWMFDGRKIWKWNKAVYFGIVAVCLGFMWMKRFI